VTPGGSSTAHIYTQTVRRIQQYSTYLHTNSTQDTAVQHIFTHKQYAGYSSTVHIYTQIVRRIQQYSTYLHTNSTQDTDNGTYITIKKLGISIKIKILKYFVNCGPRTVFAIYNLEFSLQLRKKKVETSVSVAAHTLKAATSSRYKNNEQ
jgi:hypothetical protein